MLNGCVSHRNAFSVDGHGPDQPAGQPLTFCLDPLFPAHGALMVRLLAAVVLVAASCALSREEAPFRPSTRIQLVQGRWELNGEPTYRGAEAEGLLLNVRMVNSTFEDRNPATCPKGFDPERNTDAFIAKIPEYAAYGVRAFTLNLQGGSPDYEGALNSAFEPDGSLRADYALRVARVIEACDRNGVAVILGCFYQRQDQVLKDDDAVSRAVASTVAWLEERRYTNVILEIANEHEHDGFDRGIIRSPDGMAKLIRLARAAAPGLLVSASGMGDGGLHPLVQAPASFILIHFNGVPVSLIAARAANARATSKAVVCNEDDKKAEEAARALQAACDAKCSWGYMNKERNQFYPFHFDGAADDPIVYARMKALATTKR
jgi:hypothetical protein